MTETLSQLIRLFQTLQSSHITDFQYQDGILRLQLEHPLVNALNPEFYRLQLVMSGCQDMYYNTYTKTMDRTISNPVQVFSKGLVVQGITGTPPNKLILYCTSFTDTLEAGELHILFSPGFQFSLYDQEYGRVLFSDLQYAAMKKRI